MSEGYKAKRLNISIRFYPTGSFKMQITVESMTERSRRAGSRRIWKSTWTPISSSSRHLLFPNVLGPEALDLTWRHPCHPSLLAWSMFWWCTKIQRRLQQIKLSYSKSTLYLFGSSAIYVTELDSQQGGWACHIKGADIPHRYYFRADCPSFYSSRFKW